ncbi:MAG TPA: polyprenyl diphosphate synthase [Steroidobacteraceae bacterium]|jgi:undecaprenyl diphosphate synthase|nr:polyprenyl diphosphate synthase [Steroidobacteraceae bacterium]
MHVAIIMDGNGRWATERGLPRSAGHIEGAKAVRATVETAARSHVDTLTIYAFSAANWARPSSEVSALMRLFGQYLFTETRRCVEQSIRINVIGRRDRLSDSLLRSIDQSERLSAGGGGMNLRIAVDYSAQYSILEAARRAGGDSNLSSETFSRLLHEVDHCSVPAGDVDLLIRTGSEQRLSDFLLWECAYAELYFAHCLWPDFDERHFRQALDAFAGRQRRFGALGGDNR